MHQQLWGYKVEWKSVSRATGGKKVEYHWFRPTVKQDLCTVPVHILYILHYYFMFSPGLRQREG
jgi:hypothetical protein